MEPNANDTTPPAGPNCPRPEHRRHHRGRGLRRGLFLLVAAGGFAFLLPKAIAGAGWSCARIDTVEQAQDKAMHATDFVLDRVDATDEQRDRIEAIVETAVPRVFATHGEGRAIRERARAALLQEPIDAAALEAARKDAIALIDRESAQMVEEIIAAGSVLTPEQRTRLAELHEKLHRKGHHGR